MCNGLAGDLKTPNGQFGWSIALTGGKDVGKTWMVVGKPWDSSVHIYSTDTPTQPVASSSFLAKCIDAATLAVHTVYCNASMYNLGGTPSVILPSQPSPINYPAGLQNCTLVTTNQALLGPCAILDPWTAKLPANTLWKPVNVSGQLDWLPPAAVDWKPYQGLVDPISQKWNNASGYANTGYVKQWSLFGFSVSFSADSRRLVVGVPSRGHFPGSSTASTDLPYHGGAVRLFRRDDTQAKFVALQDELRLVNASLQAQPFDSFGTQVLFSKDAISTFLFVSSSGGTDGWMCGPGNVASDGMSTSLGCFGVPMSYNSAANRLNTSSFGFNYGGDTTRVGIVVYRLNTLTGRYIFHQFIRTTSVVSMGMSGLTMSTAGTSLDTITVTMREWQVVAPDATGARFWNYTTSFNAISVYRFSSTLNHFVVKDGADDGTGPNAVTGGRFGGGGGWQDDDWFGKAHVMIPSWSSIVENTSVPLPPNPMTGYADASDVDMLIVAAPRRNDRVVILERKYNTSDWKMVQELKREDVRGTRGYWGGALAGDARFLLLGDALSQTGKGSAHLYYRQLIQGEALQPPYGVMIQNGRWTRIARLVKPNNSTTSIVSLSTGYAQGNWWANFSPDHFGASVAMNDWITIVGASVDGCVWSFLKPGIFMNLPAPVYPPAPNNTFINGTTQGIVSLPTLVPDVPPPAVELPPLPPSIPLDTIIIPLPTAPPAVILNYSRTSQSNFSLPTPPPPISISVPLGSSASVYVPQSTALPSFSTVDQGWTLPTPPPVPSLTYVPPTETQISLPTPPPQPIFNITMVNVSRPVLNETRVYPNMTGWRERQEVEERKEAEQATNNAVWIGIGAGIGALCVLCTCLQFG